MRGKSTMCEEFANSVTALKTTNSIELAKVDTKPIYDLLSNVLTDKVEDRELFMKGIDYSYYYEEEE